MENKHKIVAVVGAGGAGKTTASIKLAKSLAEKGMNVALIMDDAESFPLGQVVSDYDKHRSLGKLLNINILSSETLPMEQIMAQFHDTKLANLGVCSYALSEDKASYVTYDMNVAESLLERLQANNDIDVIIVDCASVIRNSTYPLTMAAVAKANEIFEIMNANTKSLAYHATNNKHINLLNANGRMHLVINNYFADDPYGDVEKKLGEQSVIYLPHTQAVAKQTTELTLLDDIKHPTKRDKLYLTGVAEMTNAVLGIKKVNTKERRKGGLK